MICWERLIFFGSLVYDIFLCFFTFPYGVPFQVWDPQSLPYALLISLKTLDTLNDSQRWQPNMQQK